MNDYPIFLIKLFAIILTIKLIDCDLNKNRTFINFENPIPCIRRFNSTHQIGCGKLDYGTYDGIVYAVRDSKELNRINYIRNNLGSFKLVIVTIPQMFNFVVDYYKNDKKNSKINGIVLVTSLNYSKNVTVDQSSPMNYSDDTSSPNSFFSLYSKDGVTDWNQAGKGYMFENFEIPFYVIYDNDEAYIPFDNCYDKFNKKIFERADKSEFKLTASDSLCGIQLGLEMSGSVSSTVCARRSNIIHSLETNLFCDPLGGSNYYSFLSQSPSNKLPIIILSARMDTFTMYEYYTPAANEPISSLIGFLGIAELLSKYRDDLDTKNILFVLFDNEAFDYGGSSRFASDLANKTFPSINNSFVLSQENITTIIELGQLGSIGLSDENKLYVHKDPKSYGSNETIANIIDDLIANLKKYSNDSITSPKNINQQLPPSSIHSFLRHEIKIGGISIADHETFYKNNFYHSVFDTPENLNITFPDDLNEQDVANYTTKFAERLQKLSTNIAQTIYALSNSKKAELNDQVDIMTLNKLVYCFYKNSTCQFLKSILTSSQWTLYLKLLDANLPKNRLSFYTGVNDNQISGKWLSNVLFRYFTRNLAVQNLNSTECNKDSNTIRNIQIKNNITFKNVYFIENSTCIATSVYSASSVSPAFAKFDDGVLVKTNMYSAWTESSWNGVTIQIKIFMFTASNVSALTLSLGLIISILAIFLTFLINKYSDKWFSLKNHEQATEFFE